MRKILFIFTLAAVLMTPFLLVACGDSNAEYESKVEKDLTAAETVNSDMAVTETAPEEQAAAIEESEIMADPVAERFILQDVNGNVRKWSEFSGKPILVNFWATWCGPCRQEIPTLKKLYEEYHDRGLEIIAISVDGQRTIKQVEPFVKQNQIPWVVVYTDKNAPVEFGLGNSIPYTVFINSSGEIVDNITGVRPEYVFSEKIERLF